MNKERLLHLANHLLYGKLGHEKFNFAIYNSSVKSEENLCGTSGCAIGECPIAFPNDWTFKKLTHLHHGEEPLYYALPVLKDAEQIEHKVTITCSEKFFDISYSEFSVLFIPLEDFYNPNDIEEGNIECTTIYDFESNEDIVEEAWLAIGKEKLFMSSVTATKEEVANNIIKFVQLKEACDI